MYCVVSTLFNPPGLYYATDKLLRVQWTEGKTSQCDVGTLNVDLHKAISSKIWFYLKSLVYFTYLNCLMPSKINKLSLTVGKIVLTGASQNIR